MNEEILGKFESSFLRFSALVKKIGLSKNNIEDIFIWGHLYGHLLADNHSSLYRDDEFEDKLVEKCIETYQFDCNTDPVLSELHVISEPLVSGGHTRLMERLISFRGEGDVVVVRATQDVHTKLRVSQDINILCKNEGFSLPELVKIISRYKTVFLHIHPQDLLSAVAVGIVKKIKPIQVIFINHADHIFSFGYRCADVVAEVSYYGYRLSSEQRHVNSFFLGIPVNLENLRKIELTANFTTDNKLEIFSAGNRGKYKPNEEHSFQDLIAKILKAIPHANLTVVGPKLITDWWWWKVKLIYFQRLTILSIMPYEKYLSVLSRAQIYIDSLPMTGGTALPEIRSENILISGVMSGSAGYTPFDITRFDTAELLIQALKDLFVTRSGKILDLNNDIQVIQAARSVHSFESVSQRLEDLVAQKSNSLSLKELSNIDINAYRRSWVSLGVVSFGFVSCCTCVKHWSSGGNKIILFLFKEFGIKQIKHIFLSGLFLLIKAV